MNPNNPKPAKVVMVDNSGVKPSPTAVRDRDGRDWCINLSTNLGKKITEGISKRFLLMFSNFKRY